MREILERLLRSVDVPNPERAELLWAEYRAGGAGADAAFATLLAWYGGPIYRRIWGFVRSDAAEDVFQEVLTRLHRERQKLATLDDALRWWRTVAVTQSVDAHRRQTRRKAREIARAVPVEDPAPPVPRFELQEALRVALAQLSEREQQAVALVFFEGLNRQDAARALGIHRDTFAKLLDGAMAKLRHTLATATVAGTAATTATLEAALTALPSLLPARLAELVSGARDKVRGAPPVTGRRWLPGKAQSLAAVVLVGGLVAGSLALVPRRQEMPASPTKNTARLGVERLEGRDNPSGGVLDPTFGAGGVATLPFPAANSQRTATAVQPDGKIVVVQSGYRSALYGPTQATVTRLNPNGSVDPTFGVNGTAALPVGASSFGRAVAVQPDGKIVVGVNAYAKPGGGFTTLSDQEYAVARLNPNGTLDPTFGTRGWWVANPRPARINRLVESGLRRGTVYSSGIGSSCPGCCP
jgi:RNA polymerase sigma factor (sigma-70 family)